MLGLHAHTQSMGPLMSSESQLRDKLRKIEALFAGLGPPVNAWPQRRRSNGFAHG